MAKMHPKQAVEIAKKLIQECTTDSASTFFSILSPKQIQAIMYLADFVDEVRQAKDVVQVIERLFVQGIIYPEEKKRGSKKKGGGA